MPASFFTSARIARHYYAPNKGIVVFSARMARSSVRLSNYTAVVAANQPLNLNSFQRYGHSPDEYSMISHWRSEECLKAYFGERWNETVITPRAQEFIVACWLHHYESWAKHKKTQLALSNVV
jgi:hypothetical protein